MVLFVLRFAEWGGSLTGAGTVGGAALTLFIVGLAWWAIHRLTDECTVAEDRVDESEEGLLDSLQRRSGGTTRRRRHPGRIHAWRPLSRCRNHGSIILPGPADYNSRQGYEAVITGSWPIGAARLTTAPPLLLQAAHRRRFAGPPYSWGQRPEAGFDSMNRDRPLRVGGGVRGGAGEVSHHPAPPPRLQGSRPGPLREAAALHVQQVGEHLPPPHHRDYYI
jgi:hypothetical protein